jgi:integral membrane protein (TIGR01906 family)
VEQSQLVPGQEVTFGPIRFVALALLAVALPLALLTTNIRVAFNTPQLYDYAVRRYDASALSSIPQGELLRANRELIRYFHDQRPFLFVTVRDGQGRLVSLFTPEETVHLADVKALLRHLYRVQEGALAYVLVAVVAVFVWAQEGSVRQLAWTVLGSTALCVAIVAGVAVAATVGFDVFWSALHNLLFTNDLWRLDVTRHHLIQMFPEAFWFDTVMLIGGATGAQMAILALGAGAYLVLAPREPKGVATTAAFRVKPQVRGRPTP